MALQLSLQEEDINPYNVAHSRIKAKINQWNKCDFARKEHLHLFIANRYEYKTQNSKESIGIFFARAFTLVKAGPKQQ